MDQDKKQSLLESCHIFDGIELELIKQFLEQSEARNFRAGGMIVFEGHQSNSLFIILSGVLAVEKNTDAGPRTIAFLSPVDVFGELAMFHAYERSSSVRALEDSVVLEASYDMVKRYIEKVPQFLWNIAELLAKRLEWMNQRSLAESVSSKHLEALEFMARMANALQAGRNESSAMALSPRDIQRMTALSKEVVVGAVEDLVQQKIAVIRSGKVHITDAEALERYSREIRDWV